MNLFFIIIRWVIRFLLFFVVVRNITRNKDYGWGTQDYGGMVLIGGILLYSWFTSFGTMRIVTMVFLAGVIVSAVFEGLGNRKAAIISGIATLVVLLL